MALISAHEQKIQCFECKGYGHAACNCKKKIPVTTAKGHDTLSQNEQGDLQGKLIGYR